MTRVIKSRNPMKQFLFGWFCLLLSGSATSGLVAAEQASQDGAVPIHCTVIDAAGQPVEGAEVFVYCPPGRDHILDQPIIATGKTDKEGQFHSSVRPEGHILHFYAEVLAFAPGRVGTGRTFAQLPAT